MKPQVLVVGHFPPAAGGITSLLQTIFSSTLTQHYDLLPFNIGRPAKANVMNNFGYRAIWNSGLGRAWLAIRLTLWRMAIFPFTLWWQRPAVVHIHTAQFLVFWETAYYILVTRLRRRPCAVQFHYSFRLFYDVSGPWLRAAMLWIIRRTSVFVVICKDDQALLTPHTQDGPLCVYLPNFIPVEAFQRTVHWARGRLVKGDEVGVLFLGVSESIRKGLLDLVEAIRLLQPARPKLRFLLVAVPPEALEQRLPTDLLAGCEAQGWVTGAAKARLFAEADIFVLPSYGEGMPIGILEAMAASLPVIATRVGGIPDVITEGQEGYLLDPGNVEDLARLISQLADHAETRAHMGAKGLHTARRQYDVAVGMQQLQQLYEQMLVRPPLRKDEPRLAWRLRG